MALLKQSTFTVQTVYTKLHRLLLIAKLSHYRTRKYPAHEALGRTYDALADSIDTITEQLIGYSKIDPADLEIGTVGSLEPAALSEEIIQFCNQLVPFADERKYYNISNLAQELSGAGAQLNYLSRF